MKLRQLLRVSGVVGVFATSCVTGAPRTAPVKIAPDDSAWEQVLKDHTRRVEPYRGTIREADMRATLVTPRLRKAFIAERTELHGRFAREAEREIVALGDVDEGVDAPMKTKPESEAQVVVFIAMYVTDQKDRDIAANYTIWDTQLVRGEARAKPIKIETVRMSPAVVALFPYVDRFDDLYIARFPLVDLKGRSFMTPGGDPLRLEVKSALADAVVEWALTE